MGAGGGKANAPLAPVRAASRISTHRPRAPPAARDHQDTVHRRARESILYYDRVSNDDCDAEDEHVLAHFAASRDRACGRRA